MRMGDPPSDWSPPPGEGMGSGEIGADGRGFPWIVACVGPTERTGRIQSEPIESPASEVGDNMADTLPLKT